MCGSSHLLTLHDDTCFVVVSESERCRRIFSVHSLHPAQLFVNEQLSRERKKKKEKIKAVESINK